MFEEERKILNEIDEKMQSLFLSRQSTVLKIAKIKHQNNLPIFDSKREEEMKKRLCEGLSEVDKTYYLAFLENILKLSKEYQKSAIEKMD